jgi:hypothetical protein
MITITIGETICGITKYNTGVILNIYIYIFSITPAFYFVITPSVSSIVIVKGKFFYKSDFVH